MAHPAKWLKIGWLPRHFGCGWIRSAGMLGLLPALALSALALSATSAQASKILFAGGNWAAIDFGNRCEARSKPLWSKPRTPAFVGFAFDGDGRRNGQFYVHLARPARPGASVIATIGAQPFLLVGNQDWAWSRDGDQQKAIIDAARYGASMRIETRDSGGRRMIDHYALGGAATAIDSAASDCAGKNR